VVLTNKNGEVLSHKQIILLFNSHVSAHTGHHQAICEEYTNDDNTYKNYNKSINLLVELGWIQFKTTDSLDLK
jgi:hypothetical protein